MDALIKPVTNWFLDFSLPLQIFYTIGILSGIVLVIQLFLLLFGFDHHDATDHDGGYFSIKAITALMVGLGWSGVLAIRAGFSPLAATAIGIGSGLAFMAIAVGFMRLLYSRQSSGNTQLSNAVGKIGTVYISIPANGEAGGQIQVAYQGRLETVNAITYAENGIASGNSVQVVEAIAPATLVVKPVERTPSA